MELEITPEPSVEEEVAIAAALSKLGAEDAGAPDPWWEAGVHDAIEDEDGYPAVEPRSRRGAARA